jgi:hypothetical protein
MMGVLSLLKQIISNLTAPVFDLSEEPANTWEDDILIRLALKKWIWHLGRTSQK